MDTWKIEQLLQEIVRNLEAINNELRWHRTGSFAKYVTDGLGSIENQLRSMESSIRSLDR